MSLLFDRPTSFDAAFTVKKIEEEGGSDTVLLGTKLWYFICSNQEENRICLSIAPLHHLPVQRKGLLRALTCWAVRDNQTEDSTVAIPSAWTKTYADIFSQRNFDGIRLAKSLSVTPTEPIPLTEVIITALSDDAYQMARGKISGFQSWFLDKRPILRHGETHIFRQDLLQANGGAAIASEKLCRYRLDMLEPVLQGYALQGTTKFLVTALCSENNVDDLTSDALEDITNEVDGIEIDEGFLGSSLFPPSFAPSPRGSNFDMGRSNGGISEIDGKTSDTFSNMVLLSPVSILDDDNTLYIRTADLGRFGILNGDWVVASPCDISKYRAVRVVASDDLVAETGTIAGSPILLRNISPEFLESSSELQTSIYLRPSPFGSRQPAIPTARTVTIARVASPLSVNRSYQHLFLGSLKTYFNTARRLVKQGDLIAVSLDTDASRWISDVDSAGEQQDLDALDSIDPSSPARANEVVFFVITNIEYDIITNSTDSSAKDMYLGSTVGELGCWVDPATTRMIQTGIENKRVPAVGTYYQPDAGDSRAIISTLKTNHSSHLLGKGRPFEKIMSLCSAALAKGAVDYSLNLSLLLRGSPGTGKFTVASWVAQQLGMHLLEINCYDIIGENDTKTDATLRVRFDQARNCSPCMIVLRHIEALSLTTQALEAGKEPIIANALHECIDDTHRSWKITGYPVIIVGTTSESERVPMSILSCFKHEIIFEAPNEAERQEILNCLLVNSLIAPDVSISSLAIQTAALVATDLVDLVSRAQTIGIERVTNVTQCKSEHLAHAGILLTATDFEVALGKARASYSESIGAPKIPSVSWDDVGGLAHVKSDILDTIQLPLDHPELFADGLKKRSGILLYGPPGTGKTLVAKAVATSCSLNFFSVKGPELLNMYIGESEANVRRVFQRARDAKPCVIFFDELDSVAPKRGNHGDSGGVMDRIVSQLLAELDGMSSGQSGTDVFVIGATNRPDLLDPALLRPGRFDRMLYLGVSDTHEAQLNILEALTRKFRLSPDLDLRHLADQCPFNYTGADFYALCSDAMLNAMSRKAEELENKIAELNRLPGPYKHPHPLTPQYYLAELASSDDIAVSVSQGDFDLALKSLVPSVSQAEMEHYARVQRRFSRDVTVDESSLD